MLNIQSFKGEIVQKSIYLVLEKDDNVHYPFFSG